MINWVTTKEDKQNLIKCFNIIETVYKVKCKHTQVLEVQTWFNMLMSDKTKFTKDAIIALTNILTDCANYCALYGNIETSKIAINYLNIVSNLFKNK